MSSTKHKHSDDFAPTQFLLGNTFEPMPTAAANDKAQLKGRITSFVLGALLGGGLGASLVLSILGLPGQY